MKKYTLASFKSDLKKKDGSVKKISSFDGMTDCVESVEDKGFRSIDKSKLDFTDEHTFGIPELWLVGGGRNYFKWLEGGILEVHNCCGTSKFIFV